MEKEEGAGSQQKMSEKKVSEKLLWAFFSRSFPASSFFQNSVGVNFGDNDCPGARNPIGYTVYLPDNSWNKFSALMTASSILLYYNDQLKHTFSGVDTSGSHTLALLGSADVSYFDNIKARNYVSPEPSTTLTGSEDVR